MRIAGIIFAFLVFSGWAVADEPLATSWSELLDLPLPIFISGRDARQSESLAQQFAALQKEIVKADKKHRRLPIFLSPKASLLVVRVASGEPVKNLPVNEAIKYLCQFSGHNLLINVTSEGLLISTRDEAH